MDTISSEARSRNMRAIRAQDTDPEMRVRKWLHANGYRYRLHVKNLPGRPDVVFKSRKKAIFVHGCFWHLHGCSTARTPKSNRQYWSPKLEGNVDRDQRNRQQLENTGWDVLVLWECEIEKAFDTTIGKLEHFLRSPKLKMPIGLL